MFGSFNEVSMAITKRISTESQKPCLNLCSRRWLKSILKRLSRTTPGLLPSLKVGLDLGFKNCNKADLKVKLMENFLYDCQGHSIGSHKKGKMNSDNVQCEYVSEG